ncbi:uncharacterized protein LOC122277007 [Carya illinoinensis]|uniref:uncharacterized protein LOC122277007 n=1 Tax=Carya illinoinensis TaxID=32201 RepID=UPI001C72610D|nr:uncharacterized protein LOC122277007 [Carya illinoinensis]
MKILSWNCRGLGNPQTVQDLCNIAEKNKFNLVFIMETKLRSKRFEGLKRRLHCEGCFIVDSVGKGGGMIPLWDANVGIEVVNFSQRHINTWVKDGEVEKKWLITCLYGHPETTKRKATWDLMKSFKPQEHDGWCIVRDFNEILVNDEKLGGRARPKGQMELFMEVFHEGNLYDLGWQGDKYTWSNLHGHETFTKERLDRVVANPVLIEFYKEAWVEVMVASTSDHKPLLVHLKKYKVLEGDIRKAFKYEANWALEEECELILKKAWKQEVLERNQSSKMVELLNRSKEVLQKWNK